MRKNIVAGNWKLNTTLSQGVELAQSVNENVKSLSQNDTGIAIAPPFTHLSEIAKVIDRERICLAAQNCAYEESGALTGEVSAEMLAAIGVQAVIIGHSERRSYFNESHAILAKKVNLVLKQMMKPIFCCGEILEDREAGRQNEIVQKQLEESLFHLADQDIRKCIIAYEPVWAIGTGKTASPEQAQEMHAYIRKLLKEKYGNETADEITILYGGSCKPSNAREIFSKPDVDGGLIGGASLQADDFLGIVQAFNK